MIYYVYILKSVKDNSYYIGVSNDYNKRLNEHNNGLSRSTKPKRPFILLYTEKHDTIKSAYRREKYLKSLKKRKYIEKIIAEGCSGRVPMVHGK